MCKLLIAYNELLIAYKTRMTLFKTDRKFQKALSRSKGDTKSSQRTIIAPISKDTMRRLLKALITGHFLATLTSVTAIIITNEIGYDAIRNISVSQP